MKRFYVSIIVAAFFSVSCADDGAFVSFQGPEESENGVLQIALEGLEAEYFKIQLYPTLPTTPDVEPYFASECSLAKRGFSLNRLKTGKDYVLVFEAFSTSSCQAGSRVGYGVRGGIEVFPEGVGNAIYYVNVNRSGYITPLPVPGPSLSAPNPPISCVSDGDCQELIDCPDPAECRFVLSVACDSDEYCPDGTKTMQYKLHPAATCNLGFCRLTTLFPLNTQTERVFHLAASSTEGDLSIIGGLASSGIRSLVAKSGTFDKPDLESFSANTGLFSHLQFDRDLGNSLALSSTTMVGDNLLMIVGGTSAISADLVGESIVPWPWASKCTHTECQLSEKMWLVDLDAGTVSQSELPLPIATGQVVQIPSVDGKPRVFIRSGLVQSLVQNELRPGREAWICSIADDMTTDCTPVAETSQRSGRYMATGVCLTENDDGTCSDYLVLGGNSEGTSFAEVFSITEEGPVIYPLVPLEGVPDTLFGATAVNLNGQILVIGGGSVHRNADSALLVFDVNLTNRTIAGRAVSLSDNQESQLERIFHTVTPLAGGWDLLVTGGLNADLKPTRSATLIRVTEEGISILKQWEGLAVPRAGHTATRLRGGLLNGGIVITGGLNSLLGSPSFAEGAEFYLP